MNVTVEFPCGEIFDLVPLVQVGIIPQPMVVPGGITGKEGFIAQGLEGKAELMTSPEVAEIIVRKLSKFRCKIVKQLIDDVRPIPLSAPTQSSSSRFKR